MIEEASSIKIEAALEMVNEAASLVVSETGSSLVNEAASCKAASLMMIDLDSITDGK